METDADRTRAPVVPLTQDAPPRHRFQALDSLRGICACMVVLFHFANPGIISNSLLVRHSFLFVDFFFVLSGFVISNGYGEKLANGFPIRRFMFLRWGRLYPLHFFVLALFFLFEIGFTVLAPSAADRRPFSEGNSVQALFTNLFLVQIFFPPNHLTWNIPSWSIAAEFWNYLVFALIYRWSEKLLIPACLLLALASAIYLLFLTDRYMDVFHDGALVRCLYGFGMGVVANRLFKLRLGALRTALPFTLGSVLEVTAVVLVVAFVMWAGAGPWSLVCPLVFFLVILLFALEAGVISRLLLTWPMLQLGMLSYSIYMVHMLICFRLVNVLAVIGRIIHRSLTVTIDGAHEVGGGVLFGDAMSIVLLVITIAVAALTYHFVEKPGQSWSRRVANMR